MSGNWDESALVPPQQLDADTILRTLLEHEVEFVVIGGLAVAAHGFPRGTKDVDVVPAPDRANVGRLYAALVSLDAEPIEIGDFPRDDLVTMKRTAGRPQDAADLEELERVRE